MLLLLLSLEHYLAYSRILLLHISSSLHLPLHILAEDEVRKGLATFQEEVLAVTLIYLELLAQHCNPSVDGADAPHPVLRPAAIRLWWV
jgi:hypothetical protein